MLRQVNVRFMYWIFLPHLHIVLLCKAEDNSLKQGRLHQIKSIAVKLYLRRIQIHIFIMLHTTPTYTTGIKHLAWSDKINKYSM